MSFKQLSEKQRIQRIQDFLRQISPDKQLESAREQLQSGMAIGNSGDELEAFSSGEDDTEALETLDVLIQHGDKSQVSPANLDQLEAIIHEKGRPAIDIINDSFNAPSGEWSLLGRGDTKKRIESVIPSVGRVEIPNDFRPYGGTGFVVGKNLLMTNRHVARIFALGIGQKNLRFDAGQTAAVDFKREIPRRNSADPVLLEVTKILMIHPYWDMALLEVAGLDDGHPALSLSIQAPEELVEKNVVVIGYPAFDNRSNVTVQQRIFDHIFEVKRLLPGKFGGRCEYQQKQQKWNVVSHDSSTLGGNSGSAVIDVESGYVVGLHFAGNYLERNYAVSMHDLAEDSRVVDAGVQFTGSREPRGDFYGPVWLKVESTELACALPQQVPQGVSDKAKRVPTFQLPCESNGTVTVPIHVSISVGTPLQVTSRSASQLAGADTSSEGLFSRAPNPNEVLHRFAHDSLSSRSFEWTGALSTALASHVAYFNRAEVKNITIREWRFDDCESIQADNMECFVATTQAYSLVAFRGTEGSIADSLTDLNALSTSRIYGRVHRGFLGAFLSVDEKLRTVLKAVGDRPIVLTGHSLGGAIAVLAAAELTDSFPIRAIYTFGQPAVGKGRFPEFIQQNHEDRFYRLVNNDDIVPKVPPTYRHVGQLYHFSSSGNVNDGTESVGSTVSRSDSEGAVGMLTEVQFDRLRLQLLQHRVDRFDGVASSEEGGLLPSFGDHKLANYIARIISQISRQSVVGGF